MLGGAMRVNVGVKLSKRSEVGMMPYVASTRTVWQNYIGRHPLTETVTACGISPYFRMTQAVGRMALFAEASYGFSRLKYQYHHALIDFANEVPYLGETLLAGIGANIPLGKKIDLEVIVPFIQERNLTRPTQTYPLRSILPTVGLHLGR